MEWQNVYRERAYQEGTLKWTAEVEHLQTGRRYTGWGFTKKDALRQSYDRARAERTRHEAKWSKPKEINL